MDVNDDADTDDDEGAKNDSNMDVEDAEHANVAGKR